MPIFADLLVSAVIFAIALAGMFINRKNLVVLLMCIELTLPLSLYSSLFLTFS
jgi:NADH-quinone oxidoreductase subunit K